MKCARLASKDMGRSCPAVVTGGAQGLGFAIAKRLIEGGARVRMPKPKITATNHTSFTVESLDRAIKLFCDGLDFALTSRAGRDPLSIQTITGIRGADVEIAYLKRPDHTVELIQYSGPGDRKTLTARPCDVGFAHI